MTSKEISNCLGDHPRRNTLIYESTYKVYTLAIGGNFGPHQNACFCYKKVATRSRSVSVHLDLSYDALRVHRRGRGDKTQKMTFFGLVTTRLIAHSGQSECLRNCVGELGMDTR